MNTNIIDNENGFGPINLIGGVNHNKIIVLFSLQIVRRRLNVTLRVTQRTSSWKENCYS